MAENLNSTNFDAAIAGTDVPVLVDFWATWCGPCKMLSPVIDQIAAELGDKAKVCKVNIDEAMDLAARFEVQNIPTLLVFKNGEVVKRMVGVRPKTEIVAALQ
ncbi:MAG: thioredoxin [Opitutales bacterium]|nr:thioredoxin [Opitutales bacterium]